MDGRCASLENGLAAVEGLRVARGRIGLQAPEPEDGHERLFVEPMLLSLRSEAIDNMTDLCRADRLCQRNKEIRSAHIAVVFRDLIFQDQVVSKRIPG